jgi:hypothetical protein
MQKKLINKNGTKQITIIHFIIKNLQLNVEELAEGIKQLENTHF